MEFHLPKTIYNLFTVCYWLFITKEDILNVIHTGYGGEVGQRGTTATVVEALIHQLPDVLWDISNPIFNKTTCGASANRIYVREMFQINIICSNPALNNAILTTAETIDRTGGSNSIGKQKDLYFYNILVTEDETVFQKRIHDKNNTTVLKHCQLMTQQTHKGVTSYTIDSYTVRFDPWPNYRKYTFEAGHVYYFYTTSNGSLESLTSEQGSIQSQHMSLIVHVCGDDDGNMDSKEHSHCHSSNMASSYLSMCRPGSNPNPSPNGAFSKNEHAANEIVKVPITGFVVSILISFVCGVLMGLVVRRILMTWEKKRTKS